MIEARAPNEFSEHWHLVLVCTFGIGIGIVALPFYTQSLFIAEWVGEFGWSRAEASLGIFATTITLALFSPFVGAAVDRFGLVRPVAFSIAGLVISFILFAMFMNSLTIFIALSILLALLGSASSPLPFTRAINAVFDRQRGLALGITLCGTGIAAAVAPPVVSDIIQTHGWRSAYWALAGFTAAAGVAIIWGLSRIVTKKTDAPVDHALTKATSYSAVRSFHFWQLLLAFFFLAIGIGGLIIHFVPILLETGLTVEDAAGTAGIIGVAVILGRLSIGFAVDRIFAPYVAAGAVTLCMCGILLLAVFGAEAAGVAAFAIGFAIGAEVDLIGYLVARYFGMAAYGKLYGIQYAAFGLGTGASPVLLGAIRDETGTYVTSLLTSSALLAAAVLLFVCLPGFKKTPAVDPTMTPAKA